ncbi:hypothetical protein [Nocardia sp. NPDC048505]
MPRRQRAAEIRCDRKEHAMEGVDIGAIITQILGLITGSSINYNPGK